VNGRRIGNALMRSLRCEPVQFGPASVTEPVVDEETDRVCDSFLRSIGYRGICEIEMKWDDRDGRVKIIEANPRLSGGGDAAPYAGVDQPWIHYLDLIGQEVEPVKPDGKPFKHIVLRADAVAIPAYWRAGLLDFKGLISSYRGPRAYFDLDWRDFRYSLQTVVLFGKYFLRELFSGMFKKRGN
jgi:D-aspartate ligase